MEGYLIISTTNGFPNHADSCSDDEWATNDAAFIMSGLRFMASWVLGNIAIAVQNLK